MADVLITGGNFATAVDDDAVQVLIRHGKSEIIWRSLKILDSLRYSSGTPTEKGFCFIGRDSYAANISPIKRRGCANASRGLPVFAETYPHYLLLNSEEYNRAGFEAAKYLMTPPRRDHQYQPALWRGLKFDDLQSVGSDADFVLFDPNQDQIIRVTAHHSNVDYSLYEGCCFTGKVEVFLSGDLIVDGDQWLDRKGSGKYQKRSASGVF